MCWCPFLDYLFCLKPFELNCMFNLTHTWKIINECISEVILSRNILGSLNGKRGHQSVQFNYSVVSDSLWPPGLQHTTLPCLSPIPGVYSNSCSLSQWCHPTISFPVVPFSSCLQYFPSIRVFSNDSALCIRWSNYWSFSFSIGPSNEYSGFISFRMDWFDLLAVQGTLKSFLQHHP